ncbi:MAG: thermonuclease family protein [Chromatiaceae bacterium]|nr:thermonuclease family protein [Candidatus Thioaporhodococcus sediminis]
MPLNRSVARVGSALLWIAVGAALGVKGRALFRVASDAGPAVRDVRTTGDGPWSAARPETLPRVPVTGVVDGDTLEILWEGRPEFLRYYGVNTPERERPCYEEARERNRVLTGDGVRLAFDERRRDKHGRLLAYVFTIDGPSSSSCGNGQARSAAAARRKHSVTVDRAIDRLAAIL